MARISTLLQIIFIWKLFHQTFKLKREFCDHNLFYNFSFNCQNIWIARNNNLKNQMKAVQVFLVIRLGMLHPARDALINNSVLLVRQRKWLVIDSLVKLKKMIILTFKKKCQLWNIKYSFYRAKEESEKVLFRRNYRIFWQI